MENPARRVTPCPLWQIVLQHLRGDRPNKEAFEKALTSTFTDEFCKLTLASEHPLAPVARLPSRASEPYNAEVQYAAGVEGWLWLASRVDV